MFKNNNNNTNNVIVIIKGKNIYETIFFCYYYIFFPAFTGYLNLREPECCNLHFSPQIVREAFLIFNENISLNPFLQKNCLACLLSFVY